MNPILKDSLIVLALLILSLGAAFWYECKTWPRADDDPTNKIDWDKP